MADADADPDHDRMTNQEEYLAGTNPLDANSVLRVSLEPALGAYLLKFTAISNRAYQVDYRAALGAGSWSVLTNISAAPVNRALSVLDPVISGVTNRYYRLQAQPQP